MPTITDFNNSISIYSHWRLLKMGTLTGSDVEPRQRVGNTASTYSWKQHGQGQQRAAPRGEWLNQCHWRSQSVFSCFQLKVSLFRHYVQLLIYLIFSTLHMCSAPPGGGGGSWHMSVIPQSVKTWFRGGYFSRYYPVSTVTAVTETMRLCDRSSWS